MTRIANVLDVLKVEVEQPSTGIKNLIANPSGDLGAWAWLTEAGVLTTGTDAGGTYLEFQTSNVQKGPATETIPVRGGIDYVAASWYSVSTEVYVSARFDFYDLAGTLVGSTAASAWSNLGGQRFATAPALSPGTAVTARLVLTPSSTAVGTGVPAVGKKIRYRQVTVATADTAAALGPTYTNLVTNPSVETNLTGWRVLSGSAALSRVGAPPGSMGTGAWAVRVLRTAGTSSVMVEAPEVPILPGRTYTAHILATVDPADLDTTAAYVRWYKSDLAGHGYLSRTNLPMIDDVGTAPRRFGANVTAPPGAFFGRIMVESKNGDWNLDGAMIADAPDLDYFDGATPDAAPIDYSWTGTAHGSKSTKAQSNLPYIPPVTFQQIGGSAVSIATQRRTFDGTLTVTIRDSDLDPAQAALLRPGRDVRVSALTPGGTWEPLFQGAMQRPAVDYGDLKKKGTRPTITITAYGPGAALAGTKRPDGVATLPLIPAVLEGIRIPFKINGSTNQVNGYVAVSKNDQATALDQVILARDSSLGYAWITRAGVLMGHTDRTLDYYGGGTALFDEGDYSSLGLSWDPEQLVNMVTVILLRFNAATGETEEVTYGPYLAQDSYREWGPSPAEYRVHGAINPVTYAQSILTANSQPEQRVERLRVPIRDTADLVATRALIDLYAKARVVNADRGIDLTMRVLGVDHTITQPKGGPVRWYMDLLFAGEDSVAAPIPVPEVAQGSTVQDGVWTTVGAAGAPALAGPYTVANAVQFMRKDGVTWIRGAVNRNAAASGATVFTLPAGYRPGAAHQYVNDSTPAATTSIRLVAGVDGTVKIFDKTGAYTVGFLDTSFPAEA